MIAETLRVPGHWENDTALCSEGACEIEDDNARELAEALTRGETFEIGFTDATGTKQLRQWPLEGFTEAFDDINREAATRNL